jgi:uncharacterized protein (TIGR02145 family)
MKQILIFTISVVLSFSVSAQLKGTLTDARDGKTYKTKQYGNQWWMTQNLAFKADSGCWAYNDDEETAASYGYLYDFETARTVCPEGWHLPSEVEWLELIDYLGGADKAGGKMKRSGTKLWRSPNINATNSSGFSAMPGGSRYGAGYTDMHELGLFWTSTLKYDTFAVFWYLDHNSGMIKDDTYAVWHGLSVRCVEDR